MKLDLVATCLFGLEHLLGEEIDRLGFSRTETMDGRIYFRGDEYAVARANVNLRYAERVYILVGRYRAATFDQLFEGAKALPWEAWIGKDDIFPVAGHSVSSTLFSVPDCQKILKKAIVTRLSSIYSLRWFPETGTLYRVEFFLFKDDVSLMIDTSGEPLHKRGYRREAVGAPIRETLAAAMAATARPREDVLFWDPFCGSGTIAVEAALLHRHIAPGRYRPFSSEKFPLLPKDGFRLAREEARAGEIRDGFEVFASDIDDGAVALAEANVRRAGLDDCVRVFVQDARKIAAPGRRGTIVCNPPYGERLMTPEEVEVLYREMGEHFRSLAPWQVYVITSHPQFERLYGKRADKVRKLYNGMIPCFFYQFFKRDGDARPAFAPKPPYRR